MEHIIVDLNKAKRTVVLWTPWGPVPVENKSTRTKRSSRAVQRKSRRRQQAEPAISH